MTNEELDQARIDEACRLIKDDKTKWLLGEVARLAREGWTPPKVVDPDLAEAQQIFLNSSLTTPIGMTLTGIKRGRELERAEAKPGMVWVKHDGSRQSPVPGSLVTVSLGHSHYQTDQSFMIDWWRVSHYAIINQPEDAA